MPTVESVAADALLVSVDTSTAVCKSACARILTCACCPGSAWLDTHTHESSQAQKRGGPYRPPTLPWHLYIASQCPRHAMRMWGKSLWHQCCPRHAMRCPRSHPHMHLLRNSQKQAKWQQQDQQKLAAIAIVEPNGYSAVPFFLETYGRLGQQATKLLHMHPLFLVHCERVV